MTLQTLDASPMHILIIVIVTDMNANNHVFCYRNVFQKPDAPSHSYAAECKHPQFKKILTLMEYIDQHFSIFDLYPDVDKFLDCKILAVNSNYRGYGIAGKLMEQTIQYMQEHEIKVIHVLCSSHYSARVCEKMGFKKVYVLPFVDYVVNGEHPILPAAPHNAVQILIREIH